MAWKNEAEISAAGLIDWLNEEGLVPLGPGFPDDGDLIAAGLDSMAVMQLVVAAEERFGARLGPADLTRETLGTPRALAALIAGKRQPEERETEADGRESGRGIPGGSAGILIDP